MSTHAYHTPHGVGVTIKWPNRIVVVLILVVMIAAVVGLGNAVNNGDQSSRQSIPAAFSQVHNGMTQSQLQQIVGKPERTGISMIAGVGLGSMPCWYYGIPSTSGTYQFCFDNGQLAYTAQSK
jgi:hypothetical protein